ncbi:hypothetical protein WKW80_09310 [Variovorax humicola]|uniref:Uncharacterized protein n=1 Tax=Variovorax humicola TaxID=1769758 RepID=A0ABU8VWQ6_9BURK
MKPKTIPAFVPTLPSAAPGGYIASPELDAANAAGRLAHDLAEALKDRNDIPANLSPVLSTFPEAQASRAAELQKLIDGVAAGWASVQRLETLALSYVAAFRETQSAYLSSFAPRNPDAAQIHAAKLHAEVTEAAERYRVRYHNY